MFELYAKNTFNTNIQSHMQGVMYADIFNYYFELENQLDVVSLGATTCISIDHQPAFSMVPTGVKRCTQSRK